MSTCIFVHLHLVEWYDSDIGDGSDGSMCFKWEKIISTLWVNTKMQVGSRDWWVKKQRVCLINLIHFIFYGTSVRVPVEISLRLSDCTLCAFAFISIHICILIYQPSSHTYTIIHHSTWRVSKIKKLLMKSKTIYIYCIIESRKVHINVTINYHNKAWQ